MRALAIFLGLLLTLTACDRGADAWKEEPIDTNAADQKVITELPLPPFPDYPEPQMTLAAGDKGVIYFPTKSPYDFSRVLDGFDYAPDTTGKGTLSLPENASPENPVPAIVILHGSGGIQDGREFTYADWFASHGVASFVVDYYEPRGVTDETPYVMKTMATTEVDIIADAYGALKVLGTHPAIEASRIGVTGYSYGGMATRYTLDQRIKDIMAPNVAPFALHMDIYGPCHQNTGSWATTGAPYLAIYGDADNSVEPAKCAVVQDQLRGGGSKVESLVIKGAGHAWENVAPQGEFGGAYVRGCEFSWHPKTGAFLVDGKSGEFQPEPDMTRAQRAGVRAGLGSLAGGCLGQGYTVGSNPEADLQSKAKQLEFMREHFGLETSDDKELTFASPFETPEDVFIYSFENEFPVGNKTLNILHAHRIAPTGHGVATMRMVKGIKTTAIMDIGFDCDAGTYVFLHNEIDINPTTNQTQILKTQTLSDAQLSAFERGEALQRLKFSSFDTLPPEHISHYEKIMDIACRP